MSTTRIMANLGKCFNDATGTSYVILYKNNRYVLHFYNRGYIHLRDLRSDDDIEWDKIMRDGEFVYMKESIKSKLIPGAIIKRIGLSYGYRIYRSDENNKYIVVTTDTHRMMSVNGEFKLSVDELYQGFFAGEYSGKYTIE